MAELKSELRLDRSDIKVYFDKAPRHGDGVDPLVSLTEQLRMSAGASAMIAILISPHYLKSSWCKEERDWWHESQRQLNIPVHQRVALVYVLPLPAGSPPLPPPLADERGNSMPGFYFYDRTPRMQQIRPYEWPKPRQRSRGVFRKRLLDLAGRLGCELDELKARLDARQRAAEDAERLSSAQPSVYLHASADGQASWQQRRDELDQAGFDVLPKALVAATHDMENEHRASRDRVRELAKCDALLLLGSADGRAVDNDLVAIGRDERQLAKAETGRLIPCAFLDTGGQELAGGARKTLAGHLLIDWIDCWASSWVAVVRQWLAREGNKVRSDALEGKMPKDGS